MRIDKSIIVKSIEDAIWKCGQRLSLNDKVHNTLNTFARDTVNRKTEKGVLIDEDGEVIYSKNGGKHSVTYSVDFRGLYEEHGEFHMEHNHPSVSKDFPFPECLSVDDMDNLYLEVNQADGRGGLWQEFCLKSITAEGTNGTRMTLIRGDNFSNDDKSVFREARDRLSSVYDDYVYNKYAKKEKEIVDRLIDESMEKYGKDETLRRINDLYSEASKQAINEIGDFQSSDEFKDVQRLFRDANCKLIIERWK